jgi:hypothetical protein
MNATEIATALGDARRREARPIQITIVETYLRSRGIAFDAWPETLRFGPHCPPPPLPVPPRRALSGPENETAAR